MIVLLIGPQGSGKGEQAARLVKKMNLLYFAAGDLLRDLAQENSKTGRQINQIINIDGKLIPDDLMNQLVFGFLDEQNLSSGIVFDGYPRTSYQFEELEKYLEGIGKKIDKVVYLKISEQTAITRLASRRICSQCKAVYNLVTDPPEKEGVCDECGGTLTQRPDENPEAIRARLNAYYQLTEPLIGQARARGILEEVDGERPIEVISEDLVKRLTSFGVGK